MTVNRKRLIALAEWAAAQDARFSIEKVDGKTARELLADKTARELLP